MSDVFLHHLIREELPEPAMHQWLGLLSGDRRLALSVPHVAALFRSHAAQHQANSKVIDVDMHCAPVFIAQLSSLFESVRGRNEQDGAPGDWVIVLANPVEPQLGFRADQVKGPFHALARDGQVSYEGYQWQVIDAKRVSHA